MPPPDPAPAASAPTASPPERQAGPMSPSPASSTPQSSVPQSSAPWPPQAAQGPTIKGIFVNSHVRAVERALGAQGMAALEERYGAPLRFGSWQDVPVRDEVRLIEAAVGVLSPTPVPEDKVSFEAGRLHWRNFTTTPWAKALFAMFPRDFRLLITHPKSIAERVFKGLRIEAVPLGPTTVKVVMENNDYPIDHFRGLFYEWMTSFGHRGSVVAQEPRPGRFEYLIQWQAAGGA